MAKLLPSVHGPKVYILWAPVVGSKTLVEFLHALIHVTSHAPPNSQDWD